MPTTNLTNINIATDAVALIVTLIVFSACLGERISRKRGSNYFLALLGFVTLALAADLLGWVGEGHPERRYLTLVSNTVASSAGQIAMFNFMEYLRRSLYEKSRAAAFTVGIFRVLCVASLAYCIGNAFFGYSFTVSPTGHYEHSENEVMVLLHLSFLLLSFLALILMALFARKSAKASRVSFLVYTLLPLIGIAVDYTFHGISLTYVCMMVSVLALYTDIYLRRQRLIDAQKNALMLSQINPHFTYNTLSAIAAMCDSSPKLAKSLTLDFSRYLRHNINALSGDELIPFEKELEHVECYLKIEKARFREMLSVSYSISCKDFMVPPLTVQPIVENAVKHGITQKANGGTVKISTYVGENGYVIEIIDDGVGFDTERIQPGLDRHVGLENVESRVRRLCNGSVSIKSTVNVGTRVRVVIPLRKGKKA